jgi:prolyl-tRNA synthetase
MLYSTLLGKTKKEAPKDETSLNAQLLIRGGFIQKELSGVYVFMPLGVRVLNKIVEIIREEMIKVDGQEVLLSALQNPELWEKSGRWDDSVMDIWFKTKLASGSELGLAATHEEPLSNLMAKYVQSYKDLPMYVFQFQTKFRNELRAKSGLLRGREFLMKDLYSFNRTEEELDEYYERVKEAYNTIFDRVGLGDRTYLTFASGGTFSKYSHEYQTICSAGEDTIYLDRNKGLAVNKEVYVDEVLNDLNLKKEELEEVPAIEVGNIFKQKTKFSAPMNLTFTDENGEVRTVITGAYGIGVSRVMATVAEVSNDEKGLIWPDSIAPFKVHLIGLNLDDPEVASNAQKMYESISKAGVEVLFDDRLAVTPGEKFSDADLIGIPYRAVVSKKTGNNVEVKERSKSETSVMSQDQLLNALL